jgi:hypothetical protein
MTTSETPAGTVAHLAGRRPALVEALRGLGFPPAAADTWSRQLLDRITDAIGGFPDAGEDLNQAAVMEQLRHACGLRDGHATERALAALHVVESEFLGARLPAATMAQRFFPTSLSLWDRQLNRWWCYECGEFVGYDGAQNLLGPWWCPAGHRVVV